MRPTVSRLVLVAAAAAAVSACAGIPATHYYELRLAPDRAGAVRASTNPHGLAVGVRLFQVDPPYDQDRIVYRIGEDSPEIGFYAYHRWAIPLSRMLPGVAAEALRGTARVSSIEPVMPGRDYEALLEGRVLILEEVDLPEGQRVRVRVALVLRLEDGTEIWSETVASESTAQLREVREVVERMSIALEEALGKARDGLGAALEAMARPTSSAAME